MATAGIATGLTGISLGAEKKPSPPKEPVAGIVDITKLPEKFDRSTGEYTKGNLTPLMMAEADKVCRQQGLAPGKEVKITVVDRHPILIQDISCIEAKERTRPNGGRSR